MCFPASYKRNLKIRNCNATVLQYNIILELVLNIAVTNLLDASIEHMYHLFFKMT